MTPEKEIILSVFNNLKYIDNNIASIIDNYIYGYYYSGLQRTKYKARVRYGIKYGEYKEWWFNETPKTQTTYKDGKLDGEYKEWYVNGVLQTQTTYKDGKIHGEYKEWWSNKILMYEGFYNNGELEDCKAWDRSGNCYPE